MYLNFRGILHVIFVLFVLGNIMIRPELFPDLTPSSLLHMVLICLNRKRRKMIEKIKSFVSGIFAHLFSGCTICAEFARHFTKTVVQILKGSDNYKKS